VTATVGFTIPPPDRPRVQPARPGHPLRVLLP